MKKSVRAVLFALSLVIIAALSIAVPLVLLGRIPLGLAQATAEGGQTVFGFGARHAAEVADHRQWRALRPRRPRQRPCPGAGRNDAAPLHWITSSARSNTACGTLRPSALAVFRLSTISSRVGSSTGRLDGWAPFRMRSA